MVDRPEYLLAIQFDASTPADFERVIGVEELIRSKDIDDAIVDGHDFGMGEFNVFLFTHDPKATLDKIRCILPHDLPHYRAGCRCLDLDDYEPLWPPDLKRFAVA